MLNRALSRVVLPSEADMLTDTLDGFDWTFGLGSKAKKEKKKASEAKKTEMLEIRAENQAAREASEKRQLVIQQTKAQAGHALLIGGISLGAALAIGVTIYYVTRKKKSKR